MSADPMLSELLGAIRSVRSDYEKKCGEHAAMMVMRLNQIEDLLSEDAAMPIIDQLAIALQHEALIEQRGLTTVGWEALEAASQFKKDRWSAPARSRHSAQDKGGA